MTDTEKQARHGGLLYGVGAYGLWGLMPLYIAWVGAVPALEVLAHRIVWCLALLALLLAALRRWGEVAAVLRPGRHLALMAVGTLLLSANWYAWIYGQTSGQGVETSLGYFINPLFNVLLGMAVFRERLRPGQWLAVGLAAAGITFLVVMGGKWPWIALTLASSFALYGLIRKVIPVDSLIILTVETLLTAPVALGYLVVLAVQGGGAFTWSDWDMNGRLMFSGVVTAVPLWCFGMAARRLPLTTLGFLQYLAPTMQFLLAVFFLGESFPPVKGWSFGLIWAGLAVFTLESAWNVYHRRRRERMEEVVLEPD